MTDAEIAAHPDAAWAEMVRLGREMDEAESRLFSVSIGTPEMDALMRDVNAVKARFRAAREAYEALPLRDYIVTIRSYKDRRTKKCSYRHVPECARSAAAVWDKWRRLSDVHNHCTSGRMEVVGVRLADDPCHDRRTA